MNVNIISGFYMALNACSYIADGDLRDDAMREIVMSQRALRESFLLEKNPLPKRPRSSKATVVADAALDRRV